MTFPKITVTDDELGMNPRTWWTTISDMLKVVMEARTKAIDEKIKEFWITTQNYKEFHIDIENSAEWKKYIVYKKEKLWEFIE